MKKALAPENLERIAGAIERKVPFLTAQLTVIIMTVLVAALNVGTPYILEQIESGRTHDWWSALLNLAWDFTFVALLLAVAIRIIKDRRPSQ